MAIFGGYGKDTNAYKVYIPETNIITTSGDDYFSKEEGYISLLNDDEETEESD
jgi:hypothetical protein